MGEKGPIFILTPCPKEWNELIDESLTLYREPKRAQGDW